MARAFSPTQATIPAEFYKRTKEAALNLDGEWVKHYVEGTPVLTQFVFMKFQYIPVDAAIRPDFAVDGTDPKLYGLADHFDNMPTKHKNGHSGKPAKGSRFEVKGFMYHAKKIDINHRGYMVVFLTRADKCSDARIDWCDEVKALACDPDA